MNMKNFLLAGIVGGIADFLLGWVFYGMLFREYFGGADPNLVLIFCGCMSFGLLMAYAYTAIGNVMGFANGLKLGAGFGLIQSLMSNFFMRSMDNPVNYNEFGVDVGICIVIGALVGGVVAATNGALSKKPAN